MTLETKRKEVERCSDEACDYEYGDNGKEINLEKAFELYMKCAEYYDIDPDCEDAAACLEDVGRFYYEGNGPVAQDYSEALKWFEKALKANKLLNLASLAKIYENGLGTDVNLDRASDLYLLSDDVEDWISAYQIYHTGRIINPVIENELRIKIAVYKRDALYLERCGYVEYALCVPNLTSEKSVLTFSKDLFIEYFNSDFHKDLRIFFDISYNYGDRTYSFVKFVECFQNENYSRRTMNWMGIKHYHMFSVAVFYIHSMAQVIGHLYGYRLMEDFLRASGCPLIHCGSGGHMHPIQVMYEGALYPCASHFESYISILNTSKEFIKEYFINFLQGEAHNLNNEAYHRLCKVVCIAACIDDLEAILDNYIKWIIDPDTVYPLMLFDYPGN